VGIRRFVCALFAASVVTGAAGIAAVSPPAGAAKLTKPVSVILLAETKGESVNAVQYYDNGAKLAATELGAKKIAYSRIAAPLVPAQAQTALLQAIDQHPDAMIGFPATSQTIPLAATIAQAGVPFFTLSSAIQIIHGTPGAPINLNQIRPLGVDIAAAEARYVVNDLKAKKVGLLCVQNATGVDGCNAARPILTAGGAQIAVERTFSTAATDLTDIVLALKQAGADAVLSFPFPNPLGVLANQLVQNGVTAPDVDGSSTGIEVNAGVIAGQAATQMRSIDDCNPTSPKTAAGKAFLKNYRAAYNEDPIYSAAESYDMVHLIYAAALKAGTTDSVKLEKAISQITWKGACGTYHADAAGVLLHTSVVSTWSAPPPKQTTVRTINIPVAGAKGSQATTTTAAAAPTTATPTTAKP
jgi:branched-chain amino acid transport system substrate-binding protein